MYSSSISPPHLSPFFIPQAFSFGFNDDMNSTSKPMFHHYFTTPLIPSTTPSKIHQPKDKQSSSQVKKDRNCKIVTAQGLRDRRVRLSIDIARRFFDLQDSLGFDTASKTLDWLLTKSRTAIKELQTSKKPVIVVEENAKQLKDTTFYTKKRVEDKEVIRTKARAEKRHSSEPSFGLLQPIKSCKTCESELFCFCLLNGIPKNEETFGNLGVITKKLKPSTATSDNLEMNSSNTLFCSNNIINSSGDLQEIFGGIQQ